ncbi:hypothetical protein ACKVWC_008193 [Pyricularia oryzae]
MTLSTSHKIVIITGANKGLGFEAVKRFLASDNKYHIFLGSRDLAKGQKAVQKALGEVPSDKSTVEALQYDVESDESIQEAYETVRSRVDRVDVLINNTGVMLDQQIERGNMSTREAFNRSWDVNVAGAHITTSTFLPLLLKSPDPRVVFNTSGVSSLAHAADPCHFSYRAPPAGVPKPAGTVSYRASKAGLNMVMLEWARMLRDDGVKVWAVAPGFFATDIGEGDPGAMRKMGAGDPAVGGEALVDVVEGRRDGDVGRVCNMAPYGERVQAW